MRRITKLMISAVFMLYGSFAFSQETNLYDSNGKLKIDTSFQITPSLLDDIKNIELKALYGIYESIDYPRLAYQNGIYGLVIAKVFISKKELSAYCEIVKSPDDLLSKAVKDSFYENALPLLKNTKTDDRIEFYVPFEFKIEESQYKEELSKNKCLRIEKKYIKPIIKLL